MPLSRGRRNRNGSDMPVACKGADRAILAKCDNNFLAARSVAAINNVQALMTLCGVERRDLRS
jgi:hypothetical protein